MTFPTKYGGFEKWLVAICNKASQAEHKVFISYLDQADCVPIYSNAVDEAKGELVVLKDDDALEAFCAENTIRVVHFHFSFGWYKPVYRNLHKQKIGLFAHIHCENSLYTDTQWRSNPFRALRIMAHRLKTWCLARYFDQIFACSEMVKREYQELYFWLSSKLSVLYLGLADQVAVRKSQNSVPVIACVAFHSPIKGVDVLLHALQILKDQGVAFRCVQIGGGGTELNGEDTQALHQLCHALSLDDLVDWVGITDQVPYYLNQADIYCQPSRTEALSLSIAEAMQCQLPVVASHVGGVPELVHNGKNGFLVSSDNPAELASALKTLLCSSELRSTMGAASVQLLKELSFSHTTSVHKLWEYYKPWLS